MASQGPAPPTVQSLQEEIHRLRRAVEELSILNDLARAIGASLNTQEIMHTIIHRSLRAAGAEQGVVTLVDEQASQPMKTLIRTAVSSAGHSKYHFNQALLGWMHINKKPLTINDPRSDERFRGVKWDESVRSLLCVPLIVKSSLRGVLTVYNKKEGRTFTDEDQRLLAIIAAQSAQVVENARLYEAEQSLIRMKEEVRLAARIQSDLLPKEPPVSPGYDIAGISVSAQLVGGDYFDYIPIDATHLALCLGDVSGKGLPAALLMASLQATLRGQTLLEQGAAACVARANRLLHQSTSSEKFVTLFYAILDTEERMLRYCNAGHDDPFLVRASGDSLRLSEGGIVLSVLEQFPYQEQAVPFGPGDLLVVYSDGISEAMNTDQQQFGQESIASLVLQNRHRTAREILDAILAGVHVHVGSAAQMDDMTLLVVKGVSA